MQYKINQKQQQNIYAAQGELNKRWTFLYDMLCVGNESVPKIIINATIKSFFKLQSAFWKFVTITVSSCCLIKLLPYVLSEKYTSILALEMASPGNQNCANCIGTLSFPRWQYTTTYVELFLMLVK